MNLVSSKEMLKKAYNYGYAVGAFNVNNMETIQAIIDAANEANSPVILQISSGARKYAKDIYLKKLVEAALMETNVPICLHLDHGETFELCKSCIDQGYTSIMIDGSRFPFDKNVELTKKVVKYAHDHDVVVEGELGILAGIEENINISKNCAKYTNPIEVEEFVEKTRVDSLAIAIGTSHGAYKFSGEAKIRFDILSEIEHRLPGFPIVLHGASSINQEYVNIINNYGGKVIGAKGVPENLLKIAASMAVCKINIDSDIRLAMTACIRKELAENPSNFDPRKYFSLARNNIKQLVLNKMINVLGSVGKA